ncbi:hypothetical protein ABZW03_39445 [Kitasatospora sp. NPDC004799]|uniref:hypothetical protein n=1 Tax=Kitasatospora sp. NPDC004799 TaxID=3154460 RepID=UPI0033A9FB92
MDRFAVAAAFSARVYCRGVPVRMLWRQQAVRRAGLARGGFVVAAGFLARDYRLGVPVRRDAGFVVVAGFSAYDYRLGASVRML